MKRYALFLVIIILILGIMFTTNVQAGKPKPTPNPYPEIVFEAEAYPEPDPNFPFPGTPPPDKAYVWGMYKVEGDASYRWYVSKYTSIADPDAIVFLCTAQENYYEQVCYYHRNGYGESLQYIGYVDGMSWYKSIPVTPCGWWGASPDTSAWNSEIMELHQPNWYYLPCTSWNHELYLQFISR